MDPLETKIFTAVIIAFLVIGVIILYFVFSIIKQQKRNARLQKENTLAEISAMERERSRIAADLHDDIGPLLSAIKFQVDGIESANEEDTADLKNATLQIDGLVSKMREISTNLMPVSLIRKGLATAVSELLASMERSGRFKTHFVVDDIPPLTQEKSINLFRICQEVVHNSVKHSKAQNITVKILQKENLLCLLIKDDGISFDYESKLKAGNGIGLRSLKNRAELLKGEMIVESIPGRGTAFLFEIPL
jgi:signal transduction histidine kinase